MVHPNPTYLKTAMALLKILNTITINHRTPMAHLITTPMTAMDRISVTRSSADHVKIRKRISTNLRRMGTEHLWHLQLQHIHATITMMGTIKLGTTMIGTEHHLVLAESPSTCPILTPPHPPARPQDQSSPRTNLLLSPQQPQHQLRPVSRSSPQPSSA